MSNTPVEGTVLSEIYNASPTFTPNTPRLINLSCRTLVPPNHLDGVVTVGFVIEGEAAQGVLIRAVGPSLSQFGISNFAIDPGLRLYRHENGNAEFVSSNTYWLGRYRAEQARVGAFSIEGSGLDAVMLEFLKPGVYSVETVNYAAWEGVVLIELYELP